MRTHTSSLLLLPLVMAAVGCGDAIGPIEGLPRQLSVAEGKLIQADNAFAFKLFREVVAREGTDRNVFVSPLSVGMALGMAYNGAAGTTRDAMQQALELQGMTLQQVNEAYQSLIALLRGLDPTVEFVIANSIWYRTGIAIVPEFIDLNQQYFDAEVAALDFSDPGAAGEINSWVDTQTRGKIDKIVDPPIDPLTIMFLINAIYFKGDWTYRFPRDRTQDAPFHLADGSQTTAKIMSHGKEIPVRFAVQDGISIVDLPYGGEAFSMTIAVPQDPATLAPLAAQLTADQWGVWVTALDSAALMVSIPKFTLEYEVTLNDVLTALGMGVAFSPDEADFTNLYAGSERAYISRVKHKTFVDVNEEGTEAAGVTSVEVGLTSLPPSLTVDRPFLFAIRENYSGTILFLGKIMRPTE